MLTGGRSDLELLDAVGPDGREDYRHFVLCCEVREGFNEVSF